MSADTRRARVSRPGTRSTRRENTIYPKAGGFDFRMDWLATQYDTRVRDPDSIPLSTHLSLRRVAQHTSHDGDTSGYEEVQDRIGGYYRQQALA